MRWFLVLPLSIAALLVVLIPSPAKAGGCAAPVVTTVTHAYAATPLATYSPYATPLVLTFGVLTPSPSYSVRLTADEDEKLATKLKALEARVDADAKIRALEAEVARLSANRLADVPTATVATTGVALLKAECSRCHTGPAAKGGAIDFDHLADDLRQRSAERIALGEMPPAPVKVDAKKKVALILATTK